MGVEQVRLDALMKAAWHRVEATRAAVERAEREFDEAAARANEEALRGEQFSEDEHPGRTTADALEADRQGREMPTSSAKSYPQFTPAESQEVAQEVFPEEAIREELTGKLELPTPKEPISEEIRRRAGLVGKVHDNDVPSGNDPLDLYWLMYGLPGNHNVLCHALMVLARRIRELEGG